MSLIMYKIMKIVHLVAFFQPELGYEEYYTALKQVQMGLDVTVITSKRPFPYSSIKKISKSKSYDYSDDFKKYKGIKIYRLPCAFAFYDFIILFGLRSLLEKLQPDIVHGHDARSGFTALGAYNKDLGYKYILDQHEYSLPTNPLLRAPQPKTHHPRPFCILHSALCTPTRSPSACASCA